MAYLYSRDDLIVIVKTVLSRGLLIDPIKLLEILEAKKEDKENDERTPVQQTPPEAV